MNLSTFVSLVLTLALLLGGTFFGIRLVALQGEVDDLTARNRELESENLRLRRDGGAGTARRIAELEERVEDLQVELVAASGETFEQVWKAFLDAVERQRSLQGLDFEREVIARHEAKTLLSRLAAFGKERFDDISPWLERTPPEGQPLHREHRSAILDVLFAIDPERAFERARVLLENERTHTELRLRAGALLRDHDPRRALPILLGVLDYQAGQPPQKFENLAQLVDIVGEVGQETRDEGVIAMMRRIAVEPTWEMAARNRALVWIGRLGVQAAWPDLTDLVRTPSSNHYTKLKALQTLSALDPARTIQFIDQLLNEETLPLDPGLRKAAGDLATQLRARMDRGEFEGSNK